MLARRIAVALSFALLSCNQGNSAVALRGYSLVPHDGVFRTVTSHAATSTQVVISDQPGLCGRFPDVDPCSSAATNGTPGDGTFLSITVTGGTSGDYEIGGKDGTRQAVVVFSVRASGSEIFSARALAGKVSFSELKGGDHAEGRYSVKMGSGDTLDGTFSADACTSFGGLAQRIAGAPLACATDFTPTSCSQACSCSGRHNVATCQRADTSSDWTCTCSREDVVTECTVPKTEANVCLEGNGCCDTRF